MRTNTRTKKEVAQHGGEECHGLVSMEESCNIQECPGTIIHDIMPRERIQT